MSFTNSCAPIVLPCNVGRKVIHPCTCTAHFECAVGGYDFVERGCSRGTAWNHETGICDEENKIYIGSGTPVCERDEPWLRCLTVPNHYSESRLERKCDPSSPGGGGGDDNGSNGSSTGSGDGGDSGNNTGAIVGGVFAGIVFIVLVALLALWWKKRQERKDKDKDRNIQFRPSIQKQNKEMEEEEVYDIIDERLVVAAVNNASYGKEMEYDNPAFEGKSQTDNHYSNLQQRRPQNPEPTTSFNQPMERLRPGDGISTPNSNSTRSQHNSDVSDLSRSISFGGKEILVEDAEGYQVGYPSGSVPRQPSPIPPQEDFDLDYGYDLGKAPLPNDYHVLEKTDL